MKTYIICLFLFALQLSLANGQEKTERLVSIGGEVTKPFSLSQAMLNNMTRVEVTRKDRDNQLHTYSGILLSELLTHAGATMGRALRGENLIKYCIVEASDGYQVIFALAELDAEFSDNKIILADKTDNNSLAPADGPFRIIVEKDKRPARSIKQVISIRVGFAK